MQYSEVFAIRVSVRPFFRSSVTLMSRVKMAQDVKIFYAYDIAMFLVFWH